MPRMVHYDGRYGYKAGTTISSTDYENSLKKRYSVKTNDGDSQRRIKIHTRIKEMLKEGKTRTEIVVYLCEEFEEYHEKYEGWINDEMKKTNEGKKIYKIIEFELKHGKNKNAIIAEISSNPMYIKCEEYIRVWVDEIIEKINKKNKADDDFER